MTKSRSLSPVLLAAIAAISTLLPISSAFAACSDCPWLYVRCMRLADTPEKEQQCEEARLLCEETFCTNPLAVRLAVPSRADADPAPARSEAADARDADARRSAR